MSSAESSSPTMPPDLPEDAHKGNAGRLLCIVGCPTYPGAALLVAKSAYRAGAGLVTLGLFHPELLAGLFGAVPEAVYLDLSRTSDLYVGRLPKELAEHRHDVRLMGPGLGQAGHTREMVRRLVESEFEGPLLLDADALNVLAGVPELLRQHPGPVVITPHPGEAERLLDCPIPGDPEGRLACARELAGLSGAVCVLKGRHTVVCDPENHWTCTAGNPGMATAGSGDVLAGVLGAYLAVCGNDFDPFQAACAAVQVHARAGDLAASEFGRRGLIAGDLIAALPAAQLELGAR
jgi:ADP-dependent NAD(P)H-hydrate dehydratase / NAD(P)H-hydrate epimerase